MPDTYFIDFETFSPLDLKKVGAYRYAEHPEARIMLCAIARNDGPVELWDERDAFDSHAATGLIGDMLADPDALVVAHNAPFEIALSKYCWQRTFGTAPPPLERWRCTAAMCRRMAIPWSLEKAAEFLDLPTKKNPLGAKLINWFCKPAAVPVKGMTEAEAWAEFGRYCVVDVEVERLLWKRLQPFALDKNPSVLDGFLFDLRMNDRGIPVNVNALRHAATLVEAIRNPMEEEFVKLTGLRPSQREKVLAWLRERGYPEENLQSGTIEGVLDDPPEEMSPEALRALAIRADSAYAAVSKIPTMIDCACSDNRVRGGFLWSGAIRTHRWAGRLVQPQNFKRPTIKDTDKAYALICAGCDAGALDLLWESPMEAMASCIRHFIQLPGHAMLDGDFANIEARITPWLCGQEDMLDEFRAGLDVYKTMAAFIYGVAESHVTKDQRFVGKQATLACIAEGQLVLTSNGWKPIEEVSSSLSVWDGVEWVRHEGPIYQGTKRVITYQGVTATPDHKVYTVADGRLCSVTLGGAQRLSLRLCRTGTSGDDVRALEALESGNPATCGGLQHLCECALHVWPRAMDELPHDEEGEVAGVRALSSGVAEERGAELVDETDGCCDGALHQPQRPGVEVVRSEGGGVSVSNGWRSCGVGDGELGAGSLQADRSLRQLGALRAREHPVRDLLAEQQQQTEQRLPERLCVHCGGLAVRRVQGEAVPWGGDDTRADSGARSAERRAEEKRMETDGRMVRVYDLLNAGPRHRFCVNGVLVSNCQFQVSARKFRMMCASFGQMLDEETCELAVSRYREKRDMIKQAWWDIQDAAMQAIRNPGTRVKWRRILFAFGKMAGVPVLQMRLPSGHLLTYPKARIVAATKDFGNGPRKIDQIEFWGKHPTKEAWCWVQTYGGKLLENATQAVGGNFMTHGLLVAEKRGMEPFATIHDQALAVQRPGQTAEMFREALTVLPPWAEGFPLAADCGVVNYYTKD